MAALSSEVCVFSSTSKPRVAEAADVRDQAHRHDAGKGVPAGALAGALPGEKALAGTSYRYISCLFGSFMLSLIHI